MAEAVGTTASIIAILEVSATVIKYINDIREATEDRQKILDEVISAHGLLHTLNDLAGRTDGGSEWFATLKSLNGPQGPLEEYEKALEGIQAKFTPVKGVGRITKRLIWPFTKKEINDILLRVERQKSLFTIALHNDHIRLSEAIHGDLTCIRNDLRSVTQQLNVLSSDHDDKMRKEILSWLSPQRFEAKHNEIYESTKEGTGQWFLEAPEFMDWAAKSTGSLWCPGPSGAGKTVLTSIVIEHLKISPEYHQCPLAYIYITFEEQPSQSARHLVASLLEQLLPKTPRVPETINELYVKHALGTTNPSIRQITSLLLIEVQRNLKTFIIIDALDEATEKTRTEFLRILHKLVPHVNLMITSRHSIGSDLGPFKESERLEIRANKQDISNFVAAGITEDPQLSSLVKKDPTLQKSIIRKLTRNATGMFLLPKLHLTLLSEKRNIKDLKLALDSLPETLWETYEKTMVRVLSQSEDDVRLALSVLSWVHHARRPLLVLEIRHAVAVEHGAKEINHDALTDEEILVSLCCGLVVFDGEIGKMRLVHYTTREYFSGQGARHVANAHSDISRTCLTYLSFSAFECDHDSKDNEIRVRELLEDYPLLDYAARNWGYHVRQSPETAVQSFLLELLEHFPSKSCYIMHSLIFGFGLFESRRVRSAPALLIAAYFGLIETMKLYLSKNADVNVTHDEDGWTCLSCAAWNGETEAVKLILEHGANIEAKTKDGWTALALAARNSQMVVLHTLIDNGANINTRNQRSWVPLIGAAWQGNSKVMKALLERGADVNAQTSIGWTALHQVVSRGQDFLVDLLLDQRASVDIATVAGWTPLMEAVKHRHRAILKILLEARPLIDARTRTGKTAAFLAAQLGDKEMVKILSKAGATLDERGLLLLSRSKQNEERRETEDEESLPGEEFSTSDESNTRKLLS